MENMQLWKTQVLKNKLYDKQIESLIEQIGWLIGVIEDQERDLVKMAEAINDLNKRLSEKES